MQREMWDVSNYCDYSFAELKRVDSLALTFTYA